MSYLLLLVNPERGTTDLLMQFEDGATAERCRGFASTAQGRPVFAPRGPGAPGRPAEVVAVADDAPTPLKVGEVYPSFLSACVALGLPRNMLTPAFREAERRGEKSATVRGVTFMLLEDAAAAREREALDSVHVD